MAQSDWQWPRQRPRPITSIQNSMGICVVICLCAVWIPLYNSIESNDIDLGLGLGLGLGHCQSDWAIRDSLPGFWSWHQWRLFTHPHQDVFICIQNVHKPWIQWAYVQWALKWKRHLSRSGVNSREIKTRKLLVIISYKGNLGCRKRWQKYFNVHSYTNHNKLLTASIFIFCWPNTRYIRVGRS